MRYLVKMRPLEPYSFGTEQGFAFPGEERGKETYLAKSGQVPEQTTILGMLRYAILSNEGLLKTSFGYTDEEQKKLAQAVGPESFRFMQEGKQNFGYIENVSPVFLTNEAEDILIRNPFHNKAVESGYLPIEMSEKEFVTEAGSIKLPKKDEYDAKKGYASGYINISSTERKIERGLFKSVLVVGNCKNGKEDSDEGCFFKRELIALEKGYSFAVLAEVTEGKLPEQMIVYMGQKKSAFYMTCKKAEKMDLKDMVQKAFASKDIWYYALSDIYVSESKQFDSFCIVEDKYQRNLETIYGECDRFHRMKKADMGFRLIRSGSVFYAKYPYEKTIENCEQIGYNQIVQLGGQ